MRRRRNHAGTNRSLSGDVFFSEYEHHIFPISRSASKYHVSDRYPVPAEQSSNVRPINHRSWTDWEYTSRLSEFYAHRFCFSSFSSTSTSSLDHTITHKAHTTRPLSSPFVKGESDNRSRPSHPFGGCGCTLDFESAGLLPLSLSNPFFSPLLFPHSLTLITPISLLRVLTRYFGVLAIPKPHGLSSCLFSLRSHTP